MIIDPHYVISVALAISSLFVLMKFLNIMEARDSFFATKNPKPISRIQAIFAILLGLAGPVACFFTLIGLIFCGIMLLVTSDWGKKPLFKKKAPKDSDDRS